jgi:chromate transporter
MDSDEFMDGLELAQVLPGPNILNLAIYCGQRTRKLPGAFAAFLGASVPPFLIVLIAGALYFKYASNPYVHGALRGCAVGALGLTIGNALELSWDERDDWIKILLLVLAAVATAGFLHLGSVSIKMPLLLVLVIFGGSGIVHEFLKAQKRKKTAP